MDEQCFLTPWTYSRERDIEDDQIDGKVAAGLFGAQEDTRLGRYVLLDKLGQGGMGAVYAAWDEELHRKVAIKVIHRRLDDHTRTRAMREAQALARLNHPNVVAIHDVGLAHGRVWMAMEFVSGLTLAAWAKRQPRSWSESLRVLDEAARGVAAAHAVGLVHRDLKPANVMIGADDRVRVLDFGLAHGSAVVSLDDPTVPDGSLEDPDGSVQFLTRSIAGTPAYMAPEQLLGLDLDAAADQFGWSVMAWELLFGERPYAGEEETTIRDSTISGIRRPTPKNRGAPHWLRQILERGFAVDPDRRWPSMQALLDALARGPKRARVRLLGGVLAVVVALASWGWSLASAEVEAAAANERALIGVWDRESTEAVRVGFMSATAPGRVLTAKTWDQVQQIVDLYVYRWRAAHLNAPDQRACLRDRLAELRSFLTALKTPGPETVVHAVESAIELTPVETCDQATMPPIADPTHADRLHAIKAMQQVGRYVEALRAVEELAEQTAQASDQSLTTQLLLLHGTVLRDLGRFSEADQTLWRAFCQALTVDDDRFAAESGLAWLEVVGGDLMRTTDAEKHLPLVAEFLRRASSSKLRVIRLHRLEAEFNGHLGSYADAAAQLQTLLAEFADVGIEGELERIEVLLTLADMQRRGGDSAKAQPSLDEAQARWNDLYGAEHPGIARIHLLRGQIMAGYPFAHEKFRNGEIVREFKLALDVALASGSFHWIGAAYNDLQQTAYPCTASTPVACEQALADANRAIEAWQIAYGFSHPKVAIALGNSGMRLLALDRHQEAESRLERAVEILTATVGTDHPVYAYWKRQLGRYYAQQGRLTQAIPILEQTADTTRRRRGRNVDLMHALYDLGMAYWRDRRFDEAKAACAESLEVAREYGGEGSFYELMPHGCLGLIFIASGDHARGIAALDTARAVWDRTVPGLPGKALFHGLVEEWDLWRAHALRKLGRHVEAERIWRDAVRAYRQAGRKDLLARTRQQARELGITL